MSSKHFLRIFSAFSVLLRLISTAANFDLSALNLRGTVTGLDMNTSNRNEAPDRRLSVAPMLDRTDRHCRYLLRLLSRHTLLYTEMVTTGALLHGEGVVTGGTRRGPGMGRHVQRRPAVEHERIGKSPFSDSPVPKPRDGLLRHPHGDRAHLLRFDPAEHPVALQLGGSDPQAMAACARLGEAAGYDEINMNLGCPSDRVQSGRFGACLMAEPGLVADCIAAMKAVVSRPVTVKTRIGIDERDSYEELCDLVGTLAAAGCDALIVHARKAWLRGLSPKENRNIPPLRYGVVQRLKLDFPHLPVVINGGITSLAQARTLLQGLDGVMIGCAAYRNPWILAAADRELFGNPHTSPNRRQVLETYIAYLERELAAGVPLNVMTRHLFGLFHGQPGARRWRRAIGEPAQGSRSDIRRLLAAAP